MAKKKIFKPRVNRVKLEPEQAVLACDCYDTGRWVAGFVWGDQYSGCHPWMRSHLQANQQGPHNATS